MLNWLKAIMAPALSSKEAKDSVDQVALREVVLGHIRFCGARGCTDEEGQLATNIPGNSWRPVRLYLERHGLVGLDGSRRENKSGRKAVVWFAAPHAAYFRSANGND
mgnify:FL=1